MLYLYSQGESPAQTLPQCCDPADSSSTSTSVKGRSLFLGYQKMIFKPCNLLPDNLGQEGT